MADPRMALLEKSTQDLLDRLAWLEAKHTKAEDRIGWWMSERAIREDQIADVAGVLRERGIVNVAAPARSR